MKKIGLVIYGDIGQVSGGYLYDRMMVKELSKTGLEVKVFSQKSKPYFLNIIDNFFSPALNEIKTYQPELLIIDELNHPSCFLATRKLKKMGLKLVSIVHHLRSSERHLFILNWITRLFETIFLRNMDAFVFNSLTTAGVVNKLIRCEMPSIIANPGKDRLDYFFKKSGIEKKQNPFQIISVGNVIPRKGLSAILHGLRRIHPDLWKWVIAGNLTDRKYAGKLKRRIRRLGLEKNIFFTGKVSDSELALLLEQSSLFALPSSYEGFGIGYLEAMSCGLPVIAGSRGGSSEIVRDGWNGFLINPGDWRKIRDIIQNFISSNSLLNQFSQNAVQTYRLFPTWENSMRATAEFLNTL